MWGREIEMIAWAFTAQADLIARLCDDAKKEAKIENGLEDIARPSFTAQSSGVESSD